MNLTKAQKESLKKIVKSGITEGFYLAGGTAIYLKYSHRFSEDFDFFLLPQINKNLFSLLDNIKPNKIIDLSESSLIFILNNIKFSFFKYPYKLLNQPDYNEEFNILMASDNDIISMKSIAIIQRGEKKDFFDLYFLMNKKNINIERVIELNLKKYETSFNPSLFLKAIVFFKDAENQIIDTIEPHWNSVKTFFLKGAQTYLKK